METLLVLRLDLTKSFMIGFKRLIGTNMFPGDIISGLTASLIKSEPIPNISPCELTKGAPAQAGLFGKV